MCMYMYVYIYIYTHHIFFFHSSVDGYLGCLHVLAIVNSATMNREVHVSLWIKFYPDKCPGVGLLDHRAILFLVFWGTSILFSIVIKQFYISPTVYKDFNFSTSSSIFIIFFSFDNSYFTRCEVIKVLWFRFEFLWRSVMLSTCRGRKFFPSFLLGSLVGLIIKLT